MLCLQVKANGLIVFVPKYGIEGPIYLTEKQDKNTKQQQQEQWLLDEERQTVRSADGRQSFTIFGKCAVRITVEEGAGHRRALVLQLAPRDLVPEAERVG
jgi:exosome complex exonuclease DIS3/RRP44